MLNQRIEAARPIAEKINEVEKSLNLAILQIGELMSGIASARLAPGTKFSLSAGVEASDRLIEAAAATAQSYREIVAAHQHLVEDKDEAGLRTVNWGPVGCPENGELQTHDSTAHLQAVSNS
ncbi:hypothetical protein [Parasphingorhabdus sp.]|jgi:hypothetical protein|uniref:hypothetical protein n=1 Tax=Parasphingorhabdus sp. TaxID=2709688 RepID=UPI0007F3D579|nr:hypothetical protein A8B75_14365 [Sphingomonadales bacterium EhC05]